MTKNEKHDNIFLNREYLQLMEGSKKKVLRDKKDELEATFHELRRAVPDMPSGMFEALFEPLIRSFGAEEDIVDFAKKMVYAYRLSQQVKAMEKELTVIDGVLTDVGDISMASIIDFERFGTKDDDAK